METDDYVNWDSEKENSEYLDPKSSDAFEDGDWIPLDDYNSGTLPWILLIVLTLFGLILNSR